VTPARVVSVDLAYKRTRDIGVCVLTRSARGIDAEFVPLARGAPEDPPSPAWVARACARVARESRARLLLIDGPQAWKDRATGLAHARVCERALHTPAKTGEPGSVKPRPYGAFVAFSIAVFDALHALGWPRLEAARAPRGRRALEVFPHAAWRRLGLTPLPAKAKCAPPQLSACARALCVSNRICTNRPPSHDELQALVAGIAGLSLLDRDDSAYELLGRPPTLVDDHWREGFILAPKGIRAQART
jgi:predicted RNase H-like nuclease